MKLTYKPDLKLVDELTVSLPAGDWVSFIEWFATHETDGINFLLGPMIQDQLYPQLYAAHSLKAAEAYVDDQPKTIMDWIQRQFPGANIASLGEPGPFIVVCDTCGSRDEYNDLPMGELTCGHNGPRHAVRED